MRKAWLGAASQPLTPKLAARLGIKSEGGARLTRDLPEGTQAEAADLRVGDVILALDGMEVTAPAPEPTRTCLTRQIRQYKAGTQAVVTLWRDGKKKSTCRWCLRFTPPRRTSCLGGRMCASSSPFARWPLKSGSLVLEPETGGVLVENAVQAGWANLAGLHEDDLIQQADGKPVATVDGLRQAREDAVRLNHEWWVLLVERRGRTLFVEINLKPAKT